MCHLLTTYTCSCSAPAGAPAGAPASVATASPGKGAMSGVRYTYMHTHIENAKCKMQNAKCRCAHASRHFAFCILHSAFCISPGSCACVKIAKIFCTSTVFLFFFFFSFRALYFPTRYIAGTATRFRAVSAGVLRLRARRESVFRPALPYLSSKRLYLKFTLYFAQKVNSFFLIHKNN